MVKMLGEMTPWNRKHCGYLLHFLQYDWRRWLSIPHYLQGTKPTIQDRRSTKKVPERSCRRAMYAFGWSSQYQPSCDEKAVPSRCSRNDDWTTDCVTLRSNSYLYRALWQSWIHSDRWKLLFLQKPELETTEDKKYVRENAILQHFSLAIPPSEKVACFNKKVNY